ncbi:MAG: metallopeptidase family protein [Polyangiaceae bacterium]|nr:metallopeptidase family protein [Polyangiaceae bacterium]
MTKASDSGTCDAGKCDCNCGVGELLDKAFDAWDDGEPDVALRCCKEALALQPDNVDALILAGSIAHTDGDEDEADRYFEQAISVGGIEAIMAVAEAYFELAMAPEKCLATSNRGLALDGGDPPLRVHLLYLKAQSLIELDDSDQAIAALREALVMGSKVTTAEPMESIGETAATIGCWDIAEAAFTSALTRDPESVEAHYGLGRVFCELGDKEKMRIHWVRTLEDDLKEPPPDFHMTTEAFEEVAENALLELPEEIRNLLRDAPIIIEDAPSVAEVEDGLDPRVFGVFRGAQMDQATMDGPPVEPTVIKLYQRNIEAACVSVEEVEFEIKTTLLHETAHFFGFDDEKLDEMGLG